MLSESQVAFEISADFFIDELTSDSYEVRLHCVNRIQAVALALGEERFRTLLPQVFESVSNNDSLTAILAGMMAEMLPFVGGVPFVSFLMSHLSNLLWHLNEEIRSRAVASVNSLIRFYSHKKMLREHVVLMKQLCGGNQVSSKLSCIGMMVPLYRRGSPYIRIILREMVVEMGADQNPFIREMVCWVVKDLVHFVPKTSVNEELLPLYLNLSKDPELEVRTASIESLISLSSRISSEHKKEHILPIVEAALADESNVGKRIVIEKFTKLLSVFMEFDVRFSLMQKYVSLMSECEPAVIHKSIQQLQDLVNSLLPKEKFMMCNELFKPHIINLSQGTFPDNDTVVILASTACLVACQLTEAIIVEDFMPIFKIFFKSGSDKVRASIASNLHLLNFVLSKEVILQHLVTPLKCLSEDTKWLVRLASITFHYHLAIVMGFDYFETNLNHLFIKCMSDPVSVVRVECIKCLERLVKRFGYQSQIFFVPVVASQIKNPHYLIRIACVSLLSSLVSICTKDIVIEVILPTLIKSASDIVPNVRFNTAKAFISIIPQLDLRFIELFVRPTLGDLVEDKDEDVKYFANEALDSIKEYFKEEDD